MKKLEQTAKNRVFRQLMFDFNERANIAEERLVSGISTAGGLYSAIADASVVHALQSWYVDQNLPAAKQWFYVAAKCIAISTTKPIGFATLWTCHDFMFPLLSDNQEMIESYVRLSPPGDTDKPSFAEKREDPKKGEFQSYMVQTAISGDDAKLQELLTILTGNGVKRGPSYKSESTKFQNAVVQFYSGLLAGNIRDMEMALKFLGSCKSQDPVTEDFLAFHAVVFCKLAWLRGYEVQVDSPLVPMAFMPVAPLPYYDDVYEFLKPGWLPPPPPETKDKKSFLDKLLGR